MYKKFFGLVKNPFNVSPDAQFLFRTADIDEAFDTLLYGIRAHRGLILLVGEVGTGKTILLRKLVDKLYDEFAATAFVFNPRMNPTEFLDYVLTDFGLDHNPKDAGRMFKTLQEWLQKRHALGLRAVLIVDEAQDLSTELSERIRLLSNLETPTEKLLQIILSGQPEFENELRRPELRSLAQRIAHRYRTHPLSSSETAQYIAHRLRVAGGDVETTFTPQAIKAVYWLSAGIPRVINLLCEHALISGYAEQQKPVGAETFRTVAQEFNLRADVALDELLAEDASKTLKTDAPTQQVPDIANLAGPPGPQPASPESQETPSLNGEQPDAGIPVDVAMSLPGEESVKSVAPQALTPVEVRRPDPEVISQANKEYLLERISGRPAEGDTSFGGRVPPASEALSPVPGVTVTAPGANHPTGELSGAQSAGGKGPEGSREGPPGIAVRPPADVQGSAEGTKLVPREARQPLSLKMGAPRPLFTHINLPRKPARGWPGALVWAALALTSMGVILGGYYLIEYTSLMETLRGKAAVSRSQLLTSRESRRDNLSGIHPSSPPGRAEVTQPEQAPTRPTPPVPDGEAAQGPAIPVRPVKEGLPSGSPRLLSRFTPEGSEMQAPGKAATHGTIATPSPPAPGQLAVTSNVLGATITVDGRSYPSWTTPQTFTNLSPRAHNIVIPKQGYKEARRSVSVEAGRNTSVNATLTPLAADLNVPARPQGAEPHIGGESNGLGPVRAEAEAGQPSSLARQAERESVPAKPAVQDQGVAQRTVDLPSKVPTPAVMNITMTTSPPMAMVYADGTPLGGKTPISSHLSPGHHTLIFSAAGYRPIRREIDVPENGSVTVSATLSRQ